MTDDHRLEVLQTNRMKAQARYLDRREMLEEKADQLVGQLCREGRTIYYVTAAKGVREFGESWASAVDFLIRNRYV